MFPFRKFVQDAKKVDAGEKIAPTVETSRIGASGECARGIGVCAIACDMSEEKER